MQIQEVDREKSLELLAHLRLGRIAYAEGAQPYVVPFYFAYDDGYLYSFSTIGKKINWMRANPLVCVQTDEIVSLEEWVTLVIFGRYQELPDTPELKTERDLAYRLLQRREIWWEPGYSKTIVQGTERPMLPVYFRIQIVQITGHHTAPEPGEAVVERETAQVEQAEKLSPHGILADLRVRLFSK
jgi:nitroimidazol reductase NimA-like FMN-containing flavoprotein (pyridoxamine 5'-phosphate oxidase superfamily)